MFLNQKLSGKIKGRVYSDGWNQNTYTLEEYYRSPTVEIKSVILSCIIDSEEGCNISTVEITGDCLQLDMDKVVNVIMCVKWHNFSQKLIQSYIKRIFSLRMVIRCCSLLFSRHCAAL